MPKKKKAKPTHPWRRCPPGQHWRRPSDVDTHLRKGRAVKAHHRSGACVTNPSKKDQIYEIELHHIAIKYFKRLKGGPKNDKLDNLNGNKFDHLIRGWTKYWNEVLKSKEPLDPDLVKALIFTESSFRQKAKQFAGKRAGHARGLMQITDQTLRFLQGHRKELRNYYVHIDQQDILDPNLNIAAGVRWLFRKKEIADAKFKGASWTEAVMLYKAYRSLNHKEMKRFIRIFERLKR